MDPTCSFTDPLFEKSPYSNEAFLKLSDALPDLLVHVHRADSLELVFVSRNLPDLLGYAVAELTGDASGLGSLLAEPVSFSSFQPDEENRVYTLKLRHKNGQTRAFKTQVSVFERDLAACPVLLLGVSRDITGEIELAEALQQTEQLHSQNEIGFGFGSYEWDAVTDHGVWSDGMYYLFGKDPARYRDKLTYALTFSWIDPRDQPAVLEALAGIHHPGTFEVIYRPVLPNGEERWLHAKNTPVFDAEGRLIKLTGTVVDVTNEHRTLQKLRASEALLSESERLLGYGTWVWENGAVIWSDGMAALTGEDTTAISHRPLPGHAYDRYIHPDDLPLFNRRVREIMQGRFDSFDHRLVAADGKVKWVRVRGVTTQQDGQVVGVPEAAPTGTGVAERVEAPGVVDEVDPECRAVRRLGHAQHGLQHADHDDRAEHELTSLGRLRTLRDQGDHAQADTQAHAQVDPEPAESGDEGDGERGGVEPGHDLDGAGPEQVGQQAGTQERPADGHQEHEVERRHDDAAVPVHARTGHVPEDPGVGQRDGEHQQGDDGRGDAGVVVRRALAGAHRSRLVELGIGGRREGGARGRRDDVHGPIPSDGWGPN